MTYKYYCVNNDTESNVRRYNTPMALRPPRRAISERRPYFSILYVEATRATADQVIGGFRCISEDVKQWLDDTRSSEANVPTSGVSIYDGRSIVPSLARRPTTTRSGPLLKWVGGKRQLLPAIRPFYPASFKRYIEPFFGSGAVFFDLQREGRLADHDVVLIDSNADLIGCYGSVRSSPEEVAAALESLAAAHARGGRSHYYEVRDRRFNPARDERRQPDGRIAYTPELAAMLIYLNRTGFNGLFRVNARGAFNVPVGRYERPRIADRARLLLVAEALSSPRVTLAWGSFDLVDALAEPQDFLYVDPPYAPLSATASFTAYTSSRFDHADHERLQRLMLSLATRGCHVLLSNSTAKEIAALYASNADAQAAGLRALRVPARRAVNSKGAGRGPVDEFLITNISGRIDEAGPRRP
jgi:DNA adenine methylase